MIRLPPGWRRALAILLCADPLQAACVHAQAAPAFPEVPLEPPQQHSHAWAYVSLGAGAALVGSSFLFKDRADDAYQDYLLATDPKTIEDRYDQTVLYDRLSRVSLLSGEALLATGLYVRFIRRPRAARLTLALGSARCGLSWRF
ncbi:MAG TPA: hypothetical protein VGK93_11230 [Candidatus Eisenbacteria bacterium]